MLGHEGEAGEGHTEEDEELEVFEEVVADEEEEEGGRDVEAVSCTVLVTHIVAVKTTA